MELAAAAKSLRESAGEAEAELTRRRAALDAARALEAAARERSGGGRGGATGHCHQHARYLRTEVWSWH